VKRGNVVSDQPLIKVRAFATDTEWSRNGKTKRTTVLVLDDGCVIERTATAKDNLVPARVRHAH
jgi:hypothetical protein